MINLKELFVIYNLCSFGEIIYTALSTIDLIKEFNV